MWSDSKKFISVDVAIGRLVMNRLDVKWETEKTLGGGLVGRIVVGTKKIHTFRDGASFVVKKEIIQDLIDCVSVSLG